MQAIRATVNKLFSRRFLCHHSKRFQSRTVLPLSFGHLKNARMMTRRIRSRSWQSSQLQQPYSFAFSPKSVKSLSTDAVNRNGDKIDKKDIITTRAKIIANESDSIEYYCGCASLTSYGISSMVSGNVAIAQWVDSSDSTNNTDAYVGYVLGGLTSGQTYSFSIHEYGNFTQGETSAGDELTSYSLPNTGEVTSQFADGKSKLDFDLTDKDIFGRCLIVKDSDSNVVAGGIIAYTMFFP